jgi:hypothetical protein
LDIDFVTPRLAEMYSKVEETLNQTPEWKTQRYKKPLAILGEYRGREFGLRQQKRAAPLETTAKDGLIVATVAETLRIKAYLYTERRAMRDLIDIVALTGQLGMEKSLEALSNLNDLYPQTSNQTTTTRLCEALVAVPYDFGEVELERYKGLIAPYTDTAYLLERGRELAAELIKRELSQPGTN